MALGWQGLLDLDLGVLFSTMHSPRILATPAPSVRVIRNSVNQAEVQFSRPQLKRLFTG